VLCARETQASIEASVHHLLRDQIEALGLEGQYNVQEKKILGANGSEFFFAGLKHNVRNIKSAESVDICWVEEAQSVSKDTWQTLIPTIRKEGSEIWVSYNPDLLSDATHQMFVVKPPPPGAVVVRISYRDNPWFPEALRLECEHLRNQNPDEWAHVWDGQCISVLASAIYANELRLVDEQQRICSVPYDRSKKVDCFWDLGFGDRCAVWFVQQGPFEYRLIDYLENERQPITWYLTEMQRRGYLYGRDFLPWDIGTHAKLMGAGKSIEGIMRDLGRTVEIVPKLSVVDGINAARLIFPQCWFDAERCADGLNALRHYRYGVIEKDGRATREPLHSWASHGSDAFRYFAVGIKPPEDRNETSDEPEDEFAWSSRFDSTGGGAWMR